MDNLFWPSLFDSKIWCKELFCFLFSCWPFAFKGEVKISTLYVYSRRHTKIKQLELACCHKARPKDRVWAKIGANNPLQYIVQLYSFSSAQKNSLLCKAGASHVDSNEKYCFLSPGYGYTAWSFIYSSMIKIKNTRRYPQYVNFSVRALHWPVPIALLSHTVTEILLIPSQLLHHKRYFQLQVGCVN